MAGTKDPKATYIDYSARAWSTTADGIFAEAGQVLDRTQNKDQQAINAEVKANLARIEGIAGSAAAGAYIFKGSLNGLADLLLLTNVKVGDVYNIKTEFELSGELNPGGGNVKYPAGTNVAATKAMATSTADGWDALGGTTLDLGPINQKIQEANNAAKAADTKAQTAIGKATTNEGAIATIQADYINSTKLNAAKSELQGNIDKKANSTDVYVKSEVDTKLQGKADSAHTHTASNITDFSTKVDEKITARVEKNASGSTTSDTSFYSCKATKKAIEDYADPISRLANNTFLIFDGVVESATIKPNTTSSITAIKWVKSEGKFAGVGNDGQYYSSWVNAKRPSEIYGLLPRNVAYYDKVKGKLCFINEAGSLEEFTDKPLETLINGKAAASHSHTTAEITGLSGMLAGLAEKNHKHAPADITGLTNMLAQYVTNTTYQELVNRVEKLEALLKLA